MRVKWMTSRLLALFTGLGLSSLVTLVMQPSFSWAEWPAAHEINPAAHEMITPPPSANGAPEAPLDLSGLPANPQPRWLERPASHTSQPLGVEPPSLLQRSLQKVKEPFVPQSAAPLANQVHPLPVLETRQALDGILILPILPYQHQKAFGDIALLVADELALELAEQLPTAYIPSPASVLTSFEQQGLMPLYHKLVQHYLQASRPEPRLLNRLLTGVEQDLAQGHTIQRVWLVEADVDFTRTDQPETEFAWVKQWLTDARPQESHFFVESRFQLFNPLEPTVPRLWQQRYSEPVNGDRLVSITPSATQHLDTRTFFSDATRLISQQAVQTAPEAAYYQLQRETAVKAELDRLQQPTP